MWFELLVATLIAAITVSIHSLGSYFIMLRAFSTWLKEGRARTFTVLYGTVLRIFWVLLTIHFIEVAVWGEFYFMRRLFPDRETAYYFSLTSYTTVGYGDIVISKPWRLMGGLEAMTGVLMFGWSTAILIGILSRFRDERERSYLSR